MRCGIYVRVSTDDQRDNGYSIDSQLRMIKEYCEKNNYDIVDVYNAIYIGIFEYGKYCRKPQDILRVENYCEPIIDIETWNITRKVLERNKHSN